MADPLKPVDFVFETTADVGEWRVVRFDLEEKLGEPYVMRLQLGQEESVGSDASQFLGSSCIVTLTRGGDIERRQCGLVKSVTYRGANTGEVLVDLELVPALFLLSQRVNSRIFQMLDAKAIIQAILDENLATYDRTFKLDDLMRTFPQREYTVQHRESDLAFIQRLMEEEGISYYFDHAGKAEELVLFDDKNPLPEALTIDGVEVPVMQRDDVHASETFTDFKWARSLKSTSVVVRDFDWTRPSLDLTKESRGTDAGGKDREVYESGAITTIGDYKPIAYSKEDAKDQAKLRRESVKRDERYGVGRGSVINMRPGVVFTAIGHPVAALNEKYIVTSAVHRGVVPTLRGGTDRDSAGRYENEVRCAPFADGWRPERRRWPEPRILGPQTATVVGPSGEEIYTDEHGRIKVQFHWDREGKNDEKSTCFVRVAQAWAGPGFGTVFLPRIGMEVVIHFIDGHPDRPLVVGCVYNGQNPPPYKLPDEKTKSTIFTNSSLGGGGHNEMTFEDLKGSEFIYMHAQKDWNTDVNNDNNRNIGANEKLDVAANRTKHVKGNQTTTVDGNHENTISGTRDLTLTGNLDETMSANRKLTLSGNDDQTISGNRTTAISGNETHSVTGNRDIAISGSLTKSVGGTKKVTVGSGNTLDIKVIGNALMTSSSLDILVVGTKNSTWGGPMSSLIGGLQAQLLGSEMLMTAAVRKNVIHSWEGDRSLAVVYNRNSGLLDFLSTTKAEFTAKGSSITMESANLTLKSAGAQIVVSPGNIAVTGDLVIKGHVKMNKNLTATLGNMEVKDFKTMMSISA